MVLHIALSVEALVAVFKRASEWPKVVVDPQVNLQVLFLAERFWAGRGRTLELLPTVATVGVRLKGGLPVKHFRAVLFRTCEDLLPIVLI